MKNEIEKKNCSEQNFFNNKGKGRKSAPGYLFAIAIFHQNKMKQTITNRSEHEEYVKN